MLRKKRKETGIHRLAGLSADLLAHMLLYLNPRYVHELLFVDQRLKHMVQHSHYWRRWTWGMEDFQLHWGDSFRAVASTSSIIPFVRKAASFACKNCERYKVSNIRRRLCVHCSSSSAEEHAHQLFCQKEAIERMFLPRSVAHRVPWTTVRLTHRMVRYEATKSEIETVCLAYYGSEQRYFRAQHDVLFRKEVARQQPERIEARERAQQKRADLRTAMKAENKFIESEWLPHLDLSTLRELLHDTEGKEEKKKKKQKSRKLVVPMTKKRREKFIEACCKCLAELEIAGYTPVKMLPVFETTFLFAKKRAKERHQREEYQKVFGERHPRDVMASLYPFESKANEAKLPPVVYEFLLEFKKSEDYETSRLCPNCCSNWFAFECSRSSCYDCCDDPNCVRHGCSFLFL